MSFSIRARTLRGSGDRSAGVGIVAEFSIVIANDTKPDDVAWRNEASTVAARAVI